MKIYKTKNNILAEYKSQFYVLENETIDTILKKENSIEWIVDNIKGVKPIKLNLTNTAFLPPIGNQSIWAAGVTYEKSREARVLESKKGGSSEFYEKVYSAERPELFFKATHDMVSGPDELMYIRKDSKWNVPEPEVTLAINHLGKIIGYTIGNDLCSRDIEGENPLYLPQAKSYFRSAAIGPCLLLRNESIDPNTQIRMSVLRKNITAFQGTTFINRMKRDFEDLKNWLFKENRFTNGVFLMTGTGIVPPDNFTLLPGDNVKIEIKEIGVLVNPISYNSGSSIL